MTDHATYAWLCDVHVDRGARGTGLGSALVDAVCAHLAFFGVHRVLLSTADAHGVYERSGFAGLPEPEKWVIRTV